MKLLQKVRRTIIIEYFKHCNRIPVIEVKQVLLELKAPVAPRDHKAPRVMLERRVIRVLEVPQVPRGFRDR